MSTNNEKPRVVRDASELKPGMRVRLRSAGRDHDLTLIRADGNGWETEPTKYWSFAFAIPTGRLTILSSPPEEPAGAAPTPDGATSRDGQDPVAIGDRFEWRGGITNHWSCGDVVTVVGPVRNDLEDESYEWWSWPVRKPNGKETDAALLGSPHWRRLPREPKQPPRPVVGQWYRAKPGWRNEGAEVFKRITAIHGAVHYGELYKNGKQVAENYSGHKSDFDKKWEPVPPPLWAVEPAKQDPVVQRDVKPETPKAAVCVECGKGPALERVVALNGRCRMCDPCYRERERVIDACNRHHGIETIPGAHDRRLADSAPWVLLHGSISQVTRMRTETARGRK